MSNHRSFEQNSFSRFTKLPGQTLLNSAAKGEGSNNLRKLRKLRKLKETQFLIVNTNDYSLLKTLKSDL